MNASRIAKIIFWSVPLILAILVLRPVPILKEKDCLKIEGKVVRLFESGVMDVSIILEDDRHWFYINRGLENGLNMDSLRKKILGKKVTLKYPDYWTPLDWDKSHRHVSMLIHEGEILFDETIK